MKNSSNIFKTGPKFVKEAYAELQKVKWFSKQEVFQSTILVVIVVILVSLYVGLVDLILSRLINWILGV